MLGKKRRGVTRRKATTPKHKQQQESYRKPASASTKFRELAANLLIGLQGKTLTERQSRNGWKLFEVVLQQYVDLKYGRTE